MKQITIFFGSWASEFKYFLYNSFVFAEMKLRILKDKNLQAKQKVIFTIFSVIKFIEQNIAYYKLIK